MSRRWILLFVTIASLGLAAAASPQDSKTAAPPKAKPEDVKSIDAIVGALYDVISGPKGQARDWDRMRSLFVPDARLIPVRAAPDGTTRVKGFTVDEYAKLSAGAFDREGFYESEVSRKVESFGAIAHVFSTYESRHEKGGEPFARGINSIQLLKSGDRWHIVTVYWDAERPGLTLPAEYLPKK